jgi:DNA-binding transcriptional ArsR family regulator
MRGNRELERMVKGFANHRRIEVMRLLAQEPELSLAEIAERTKINVKTASEHLRRLAIAGVVLKRNEASSVRHALSPRGILILKFLRTLE